jgi:hypothetical protein
MFCMSIIEPTQVTEVIIGKIVRFVKYVLDQELRGHYFGEITPVHHFLGLRLTLYCRCLLILFES